VGLFQDHYEHRDGKVIKPKAGAVIELPDEEAEFVAQSTLAVRAARQELAERTPGTPERKRKHDL
jgi:hypothetical protein